jgi:hypothetical protein
MIARQPFTSSGAADVRRLTRCGLRRSELEPPDVGCYNLGFTLA